MDSKDLLGQMYDDFFGIEKQNIEIKNQLENLDKDYPEIEIKKDSEIKMDINEKMSQWFEKIDNLLITDESKSTLKKIIEYERKFYENIEKEYIHFSMCIVTDNNETTKSISKILSESGGVFKYIENEKICEKSFFEIENANSLESIFESGTVIFSDIEVLNKKEQDNQEKIIYMLNKKMNEEKLNIIIQCKDIGIINSELNKNLNFVIKEVKPEVQDVYQNVLEKLKQNNEISDDVEIKLLDYISATYPNSNVSFPEYIDKLYKEILFNKQDNEIVVESIPKYEEQKSTEEIFKELNELVGLEKVKHALNDLVSLNELKEKSQGELKIQSTNLHMVFLGNPGTGKTTVARIVAQILYNLKYIKQNKLIEVSSKDLVAEYVGQTGPKTMAVIEKSLGGVLFIDEAYSLASGNGEGNSYKEEAIATLIQAMENNRDNLVVIFAGYTKEMQAFLNANSGIVSRIGYTLEFDDYTEDELLKIFKSMLSKAGFEIEDEALNEAKNVIIKYKQAKNFGNARFVRNLYEKTIIKHASNTKNKKSRKILKTITKKDISTENLLLQ